MKKELLIVALVVQFIFIVLSGCLTEDNTVYDSSYFLGTWSAIEIPNISNDSYIPVEYTWTFFKNSTMAFYVYFQNGTSNQSLSLRYDYIIKNSELCISLINDSINEKLEQCYIFQFSNDNNRFALIQDEVIIIVFNKLD